MGQNVVLGPGRPRIKRGSKRRSVVNERILTTTTITTNHPYHNLTIKSADNSWAYKVGDSPLSYPWLVPARWSGYLYVIPALGNLEQPPARSRTRLSARVCSPEGVLLLIPVPGNLGHLRKENGLRVLTSRRAIMGVFLKAYMD